MQHFAYVPRESYKYLSRAESKRAHEAPYSFPLIDRKRSLLNLSFLKLHVLTHDGVIFTKTHFFRGIARVLLRYIKESGVSSAEQFYFDSGWLRHGPFLLFELEIKRSQYVYPSKARSLRVWTAKVNSVLMGKMILIDRLPTYLDDIPTTAQISANMPK